MGNTQNKGEVPKEINVDVSKEKEEPPQKIDKIILPESKKDEKPPIDYVKKYEEYEKEKGFQYKEGDTIRRYPLKYKKEINVAGNFQHDGYYEPASLTYDDNSTCLSTITNPTSDFLTKVFKKFDVLQNIRYPSVEVLITAIRNETINCNEIDYNLIDKTYNTEITKYKNLENELKRIENELKRIEKEPERLKSKITTFQETPYYELYNLCNNQDVKTGGKTRANRKNKKMKKTKKHK